MPLLRSSDISSESLLRCRPFRIDTLYYINFRYAIIDIVDQLCEFTIGCEGSTTAPYIHPVVALLLCIYLYMYVYLGRNSYVVDLRLQLYVYLGTVLASWSLPVPCLAFALSASFHACFFARTNFGPGSGRKRKRESEKVRFDDSMIHNSPE